MVYYGGAFHTNLHQSVCRSICFVLLVTEYPVLTYNLEDAL
jgi:hypothetical protein